MNNFNLFVKRYIFVRFQRPSCWPNNVISAISSKCWTVLFKNCHRCGGLLRKNKNYHWYGIVWYTMYNAYGNIYFKFFNQHQSIVITQWIRGGFDFFFISRGTFRILYTWNKYDYIKRNIYIYIFSLTKDEKDENNVFGPHSARGL